MPHATTIAIQYPDHCSNQTSGQQSGEAKTNNITAKMDCGVELAELERVLSRSGFRVISGQQLRGVTNRIDMAKQMGAQVLLQINSLESGSVGSALNVQWERTYTRSDASGEGTQPAELSAGERREVLGLVGKVENAYATALQQDAAILDLTAVEVATNESFWFYKWAHSDLSQSKRSMRSLLMRKTGGSWQLAEGGRARVDSHADGDIEPGDRRSSEQGYIRIEAGHADARAKEAARLRSELFENFIQRFGKFQR